MSKKVITFVGMPGAGKSTCVDYLQAKGLPSVYFGGITLDELRARGLDDTPENEKMVREDIRRHEGMGAYATRMVPKIKELFDQNEQVVADGLYSWSEYKIIKEEFGDDAIIIAIAAPRKDRHDRLANRPVRPMTDEEVTGREYAEIENIEKGGPIANADYTIVNDGTPDELITKLQSVLTQAGVTI